MPKAEFGGELSTEQSRPVGLSVASSPIVEGSTARVALADQEPDPGRARAAPAPPADLEALRKSVLAALAEGGQPMLVSMLEEGEWRIEGGDVVVMVAASSTVIDMSVGASAKRIANAAARGVLGRPAKLRVVPGGTPAASAPRPASSGGRNRAEQDPIVRRMQEKFGAEIRSIIDQREKR
jgi:DNA polymerase-3 subunit gamma/tau